MVNNIIIFLGPPGIGKGTQAKILATDPDVIHLSTGDIIRDEVGRKSAIGILMEEMGWSSPEKLDVLVLESVMERLDKITDKTIILDGCPRSMGQAEMLDDLLAQHDHTINRVIAFHGDKDMLVKRMSGRYTCAVASCKEIYHDSEKPTLVENTCDICGSKEFYRRPEDSPETILKRLALYEEMTLPVVNHYSHKGLVSRVDGIAGMDGVSASVLACIG